MRNTIFLLLVISLACSEKETSIADMNVYEGPVRRGNDVEMTYSEESTKKVVLKAKVLLEFKEGNREFPEGMFIEFYNEQGKLSSTLKADYGYYFKDKNLWKATGDVQVESLEKNQQLNLLCTSFAHHSREFASTNCCILSVFTRQDNQLESHTKL